MIFLVGPLPDPVHGASLVTARVAAILAGSGLAFCTLDTSPRTRRRGAGHHFQRMLAFAKAAAAIAKSPAREATVYVSLSGGLGLLYDLMVVTIARAKRFSIICHHHSFAYVA